MDKKYDVLYRLYKLITNDSEEQISGTLDFFLNNLDDLSQFEDWYKNQGSVQHEESFDERFNRWFREREDRLKENAFKGGYLEKLE